MSRDYYTRHSDATTASRTSLGDSTVSDFDPEHEAIVSTRQLDNSHRLPEIRESARKYGDDYARDEPDFAIDTSALHRAFPDFSQIHTSEEDEDISVEVGRGAKKQSRRLDDSRTSIMSFENSVRSSSPAVKLDYLSPQTQSKSGARTTAKRVSSGGDNLRKDAQLRQASLAQKENRVPQVSRPRNPTPAAAQGNEHRRTLSEMHAKVRDTYDGSYIGDERPPSVTVNARTTRFGSARANQISARVADAVNKASHDAYAKDSRRGKTDPNARNPTNGTLISNIFPDTVTHQSFLLPDLPNLSELVSGVYEDGTPVFSRQSKSRGTRFVSLPGNTADTSQTPDHMPLDAVPIPEDEKALFVSLRLLQDKVAELELARSEAEKKVEGIRQENATLKADKVRRQREQYNRLRMYGGEEDDYGKSTSRLASETNRLEAANLALQNRLDIADRKVQVHEAAVKKLTRERDMAVSQLGVAYLNSQDLKTENETLRQENAELRAQLTKLMSFSRKSTNRDEDTMRSERSVVDAEVAEDSQLYIQRSVDNNRQFQERPSNNTRRGLKTANQQDSRARVSTQIDEEISRLEKEQRDEALFSLDLPYPSRVSAKQAKPESHSQSEIPTTKKQPNMSKQRVKKVIVEDVDVTEPVSVNTEDTRNQTEADQDLTLLSFIDGREIAQLRKTLEEERVARKQRQATGMRDYTANETVGSSRQTSIPALPRKSSLKETKAPSIRRASAGGETTGRTSVDGDDDLHLRAISERRRRHSDNSLSTVQRRRRTNTEEMTSAFIVPDITLHHADSMTAKPAKLSGSAKRVLDSIAKHDGENCMVCKRFVPSGVDHSHDTSRRRETITVPKPVPVSERMPKPSVYEEEPTLRPSQPPALALATVLKSLEDELSHLKMQLARCQSAYNKVDASASRRQRKMLYEKVENLLRDIDMKSDQIYALYDVLEGQKQHGHEMTEQEVEVTLQSIGIDVNPAGAPDTTRLTNGFSKTDAGADADTDDDDDELPWEGIESTGEVTGRSFGGRHDN